MAKPVGLETGARGEMKEVNKVTQGAIDPVCHLQQAEGDLTEVD